VHSRTPDRQWTGSTVHRMPPLRPIPGRALYRQLADRYALARTLQAGKVRGLSESSFDESPKPRGSRLV